MAATTDVPVGVPFDLGEQVVGLDRRSGRACFTSGDGHGPPRIDGYTVGAPLLVRDAPHAGEMHPDADELLYIVSGSVDAILELEDGQRVVALGAGQALVVPRGVWHRIVIQEPSRLVHITPGPGGEHRPLPPDGATP